MAFANGRFMSGLGELLEHRHGFVDNPFAGPDLGKTVQAHPGLIAAELWPSRSGR